MNLKILFCGMLSLLLFHNQVLSQKLLDSLIIENTTYPQSFSSWQKIQHSIDRTTESQLYRMTYIAVPLIAAGVIVKNENDHFHSLRNDYLPYFNNHYDDYLQYSPAIVMLGLKTVGVKGRSTWERMLVADAFSVAIMASTVNLLKSNIPVTRPDGSGNNSFPSGHTATAFMTATMLHKEYGLTRSPWYSVGAYTAATATAISRQMNNKHWMSDVLAGAGIGILSTELGYYLASLIYKDNGIISPYQTPQSFDNLSNPSFFGLYVSFNLAHRDILLSSDIRLSATTGSDIGAEGAWFFNRYLGVGGRFTVSSIPITFDKEYYFSSHPQLALEVTDIQSGNIDILSGMAGLYISYPLTNRWLIGSKILAGCNYWRSNMLTISHTPTRDGVFSEKDIVKIDPAPNINFGTGLSLLYATSPNLGVRLFCDYNMSPTRLEYSAPEKQRTDTHFYIQSLSLGFSVNILFYKEKAYK